MDVTMLARSLIEPVPANRTFGLEVLRAGDGSAEVALTTPPAMTNVIGSLHASGLVGLLDAAGLAAVIGSAKAETQFDGIVALGASAAVEFRAPARGRLVASCRLDEDARASLQPLLTGEADRARVSTAADVLDEQQVLVCRGSFDWSIRRLPEQPG